MSVPDSSSGGEQGGTASPWDGRASPSETFLRPPGRANARFRATRDLMAFATNGTSSFPVFAGKIDPSDGNFILFSAALLGIASSRVGRAHVPAGQDPFFLRKTEIWNTELRQRLWRHRGIIMENVTVMPWLSAAA